MASQPHPKTMTVSFTLPRQLAAAVDAHAAAKLTNKSDIIRRALLDYLGPEEAARIMDSVMRDRADDVPAASSPQLPVNYPAKKLTNRKKKS